MIEIKNLQKVVNGNYVLNIPELVFKDGNIYGIFGRDDSIRKLLRIVLDLENPTHGEILIDNHLIRISELWKKNIGAYLGEDFLIDFLTPEEYFELLFRIKGLDLKMYSNFVLLMEDFFNYDILNRNKPIRAFPKINRKKIGISGALIGKIKTLILDEPFSNLDLDSQYELKSILQYLNKKNNLTIIMTGSSSALEDDLFDEKINVRDGKVMEVFDH